MADYDRIGKISHTTSLPLSTLILSPSYRELRSNWSSGGWLQQERTGAEALEGDGGEPQTSHCSLARSQGIFGIWNSAGPLFLQIGDFYFIKPKIFILIYSKIGICCVEH